MTQMTTAWDEDLGLWGHELGMSWLHGGLWVEMQPRNWLGVSKEHQRGFRDGDAA